MVPRVSWGQLCHTLSGCQRFFVLLTTQSLFPPGNKSLHSGTPALLDPTHRHKSQPSGCAGAHRAKGCELEHAAYVRQGDFAGLSANLTGLPAALQARHRW